jgi:hypothetical protein
VARKGQHGAFFVCPNFPKAALLAPKFGVIEKAEISANWANRFGRQRDWEQPPNPQKECISHFLSITFLSSSLSFSHLTWFGALSAFVKVAQTLANDQAAKVGAQAKQPGLYRHLQIQSWNADVGACSQVLCM